MVGLQPSGLIGNQRIGRRVRFIEAISGKAVNLVENLRRLIALYLELNRAVDKARLLRVHFGLNLFTHRAAQQVSLA